MFSFPKEYFIIECKRIDASKTLNRSYLKDGVERFVGGENPIYTSYFKKNCMFGFVVQEMDIDLNTKKINQLQNEEYSNIRVRSEIKPCTIDPDYTNTYISSYFVGDTSVQLYHLFYDFSEIIS